MSPRTARALTLVCVLVACLAAVAPAQAGPPLLCHPFDIGVAKSLSWDGATGLSTGRADYAIDRFVAETEALLGPATPVIVRMETLRRAAIYASRDRQVASQLLERLTARARAAEQSGKPDSLALLDAAYGTEAFRQTGMLGRSQGFGERAPIARAVVGDTDGTALMAKSLATRPNDAGSRSDASRSNAETNTSWTMSSTSRCGTRARTTPCTIRTWRSYG